MYRILHGCQVSSLWTEPTNQMCNIYPDYIYQIKWVLYQTPFVLQFPLIFCSLLHVCSMNQTTLSGLCFVSPLSPSSKTLARLLHEFRFWVFIGVVHCLRQLPKLCANASKTPASCSILLNSLQLYLKLFNIVWAVLWFCYNLQFCVFEHFQNQRRIDSQILKIFRI